MPEQARVLYRGVVVDDLARLVQSPDVRNAQLGNSILAVNPFAHPGLFFTTSGEGVIKRVCEEASLKNGMPIVFKIEVTSENFPLLQNRAFRIVDVGGVEFEFENLRNYKEFSIPDTLTLNLHGLTDEELKRLKYQVIIVDPSRDLAEAEKEFRSYVEVKKEIAQHSVEGKISGEG